MLELVQVTKSYDSPGDTGSVCVLKDISLKLDSGRSMVIVGPSGSGKSTLLNIIGTLDRPTQGQVLFDGQDLTLLNETELAKVRNRLIGFVFQLHHLLPQCTVLGPDTCRQRRHIQKRGSGKGGRTAGTGRAERIFAVSTRRTFRWAAAANSGCQGVD